MQFKPGAKDGASARHSQATGQMTMLKKRLNGEMGFSVSHKTTMKPEIRSREEANS